MNKQNFNFINSISTHDFILNVHTTLNACWPALPRKGDVLRSINQFFLKKIKNKKQEEIGNREKRTSEEEITDNVKIQIVNQLNYYDSRTITKLDWEVGNQNLKTIFHSDKHILTSQPSCNQQWMIEHDLIHLFSFTNSIPIIYYYFKLANIQGKTKLTISLYI